MTDLKSSLLNTMSARTPIHVINQVKGRYFYPFRRPSLHESSSRDRVCQFSWFSTNGIRNWLNNSFIAWFRSRILYISIHVPIRPRRNRGVRESLAQTSLWDVFIPWGARSLRICQNPRSCTASGETIATNLKASYAICSAKSHDSWTFYESKEFENWNDASIWSGRFFCVQKWKDQQESIFASPSIFESELSGPWHAQNFT